MTVPLRALDYGDHWPAPTLAEADQLHRQTLRVVAYGHVPNSENDADVCVKCHERLTGELTKCSQAHRTLQFDGPFWDVRTGRPL